MDFRDTVSEIRKDKNSMLKKNVLLKTPGIAGYDQFAHGISQLLENARKQTARSVNAILTVTYWEVGRRIVEFEQKGNARAHYGETILERLAKDMTERFGKGFSRQNLQQMRLFYQLYPLKEICQTLSGKSDGKRAKQYNPPLDAIAEAFPLSWSHYARLISVRNAEARLFYTVEAVRGGWSVRQLDRQIDSQFYERTALSRDKAAMLTKGTRAKPEDHVTPEEEIKNPYVLEFLGLKDEYSELDLEDALIRHLESFLLELGSDFTFVARQKRLRVGDAWYRIDLVFYHRRLRCLVLIDLKLGKFTHADAGQMHLYLNYAREHWTHKNENPPVGLILCAQRDAAVAHYALENLPNKVLASEYRTALPKENTLINEIKRTELAFKTGRIGKSQSGKK